MRIEIPGLILTLVLCLAETGCSAGDSCTADTWRCFGSELQYCAGHPGGPHGDLIDPHWQKGRSPSWSMDAQCLPGTCIAPSVGQTCTLEAHRNPACPSAATAFACDGDTALDCVDGYVVERKKCRLCDAKQQICDGAYDADCQVDTDCADGLICDSGYCGMSCTCAEGTACPACDVLDSEAHNTKNNPPAWQCYAGHCRPY